MGVVWVEFVTTSIVLVATSKNMYMYAEGIGEGHCYADESSQGEHADINFLSLTIAVLFFFCRLRCCLTLPMLHGYFQTSPNTSQQLSRRYIETAQNIVCTLPSQKRAHYRISAHPPVLAQCKVHRPWALFHEGTVHVYTCHGYFISVVIFSQN